MFNVSNKEMFTYWIKRLLVPTGLLLLFISFGWQCIEEHSSGSLIECYAYEIDAKLSAIWSAVYDEVLNSDRYKGEVIVNVDYDVLNKNFKDWNLIQEEYSDILAQKNTAFYVRLTLFISGCLMILFSHFFQMRGSNMESKKQDDSVSHGKQSDKEPLSLQCVFKVIVLMFSLVFTFIVFWQVITSSGKVQPIELTIMAPADSSDLEMTIEHNKLQLQKLSQEIALQNEAINDRYDLLVRAKEMEGNFIRLISAIGAFILALLGFLGYKTIKDIETKVELSAERKAEEVAKLHTKERLTQVVSTKLKDIVSDNDVMRTITSKVEADLNATTIANLEKRLSSLEELEPEDRTTVSPPYSSTFGTTDIDQLIDKKD